LVGRRRSSLSTSSLSSSTTTSFDSSDNNSSTDDNDDSKFKIATSGIPSYRINVLNRLQTKSKQNATTIIDYLFLMHNEINPSAGYKANQIIILSQLSESCNNQKSFSQMKILFEQFTQIRRY
jgi:hypothetical protein